MSQRQSHSVPILRACVVAVFAELGGGPSGLHIWTRHPDGDEYPNPLVCREGFTYTIYPGDSVVRFEYLIPPISPVGRYVFRAQFLARNGTSATTERAVHIR
jgi:hypothetical protein